MRLLYRTFFLQWLPTNFSTWDPCVPHNTGNTDWDQNIHREEEKLRKRKQVYIITIKIPKSEGKCGIFSS